MLVDKILIINSWYKKIFKTKPKFAVLGLNPHNAELRKSQKKKNNHACDQ